MKSKYWGGRSKIAPLFFMDVLEMDEGGYVDTFFLFSDTKEGWEWQFYINLSIFDTGQNCPTENFDGANLDMDPINLFISVNHVPMEVGTDVLKNVRKKNVFKMCFRTQIMQKRTWKTKWFFFDFLMKNKYWSSQSKIAPLFLWTFQKWMKEVM